LLLTGQYVAKAGERIDGFVERIVCVGPTATLRRGYTIARDVDGRPLATKRRAEEAHVFEEEFQDGRLDVEVRDR
jgi:exonuclease VII large subunit